MPLEVSERTSHVTDDTASDVACAPENGAPATEVAAGETATESVPSAGGDETTDVTASLTPLDDLTAESDYTQFFAKGVPEAVKRAALRKLWASDPVFAVLDGLNDYDHDFNLIDRVISAADTNYQIGRGFRDQDRPAPADEADEPKTVAANKTTGNDSDSVNQESGSGDGAATGSGDDDTDETAHGVTDATPSEQRAAADAVDPEALVQGDQNVAEGEVRQLDADMDSAAGTGQARG